MKVVHWTLVNGSGLHHMAWDISQREVLLGIDSRIVDTLQPITDEIIQSTIDADVHIIHSHIPDSVKAKAKRMIYVAHGTPEHCFQSAVESGLNRGYGAGDSWMMLLHYLQVCDVTVTWWPRHQAILQSLSDKGSRVEIVPMGVDTTVFRPEVSRGKWVGSPSVLTAENCHYIKWPLDLFILWPWVVKELPNASLHAHYLPRDQHRWFMPLVYRNGTAYKCYLSGDPLSQSDLINAMNSVDFYIGLVRYGDFDRLAMEAKACGCKLISYAGNEYADYWITEGDQRRMAEELVAILSGQVTARESLPAVDISQTAEAMVKIYESLTVY